MASEDTVALEEIFENLGGYAVWICSIMLFSLTGGFYHDGSYRARWSMIRGFRVAMEFYFYEYSPWVTT